MSNFYRYTKGVPSFVSKEHLIQLLRRTKYKDNSVSIKVTESENRVVVIGRKKFIFPYGKEIFKIEYDSAEKTISVNISGSRVVELEQLLTELGLKALYFIFKYTWAFTDYEPVIKLNVNLTQGINHGIATFTGHVKAPDQLLGLIRTPERELVDLAGMELVLDRIDDKGGTIIAREFKGIGYISLLYSGNSLSIYCTNPGLIKTVFHLMAPGWVMLNYTINR